MKRKTIILAMSCNQPFFQDEELVIRTRGYARYILDGYFPGIDFWTYTASVDDKYHINKREHKLSVPTGDGLYDTFEKTKAAFQLLILSGIEFDYIFRTNLSTHVSPKLLQLFVDGIPDDQQQTIFSSCIYCSKDSTGPVEYSLYGVGNSLLLLRRWVEDIASADFQEVKAFNHVKPDDKQTIYQVDDNAIGLICNTLAMQRGLDPWSIWKEFNKLPVLTPEMVTSGQYSYFISVPFRDYNENSDRQIEFTMAELMAQKMLVPSDAITPDDMYRYQTPADVITTIDFKAGLSVTCTRETASQFAASGLSLNEFFTDIRTS